MGSKIIINFCSGEKEWEYCYRGNPKVGKVRKSGKPGRRR